MTTGGKLKMVKEHFAGLFTGPDYDGSYHHDEWPQNDREARESFGVLTNGIVQWCQIHGDFKNAVKRADFEPYPYWAELYGCCRDILKAYADLNAWFCGPVTCAKIMGDVMALLRQRRGVNVPKWWLPIMKRLREMD
jgi:hypothetical protein